MSGVQGAELEHNVEQTLPASSELTARVLSSSEQPWQGEHHHVESSPVKDRPLMTERAKVPA